jgi:hypothetical protein
MKLELETGPSGSALTLSATMPTNIELPDIVTFVQPTLTISVGSGSQSVVLESGITIFGSPLADKLSAGYDAEQGAFIGSVQAPLTNVPLPDGSTEPSVTLGVYFAADGEGFRITRIEGLPATQQDMAQQFAQSLNNAEGTCEQVVEDWLNDLTVTSLSPKITGMPRGDGDGKVVVPFSLDYSLTEKATGHELAAATIENLEAVCDIPSSLQDLPESLLMSIIISLPDIAVTMLEDEDTYKALAAEVVTRVGAKTAASFICRALEKGWTPAAEAVEAAAEAAAQPSTLASALPLVVEDAAVALAVLGTATGGVLAVVDRVMNALEGSDGPEKTQAESQLQEECDSIQTALDTALAAVQTVSGELAITALTVGVDPDGDYTAEWGLETFDPADVGEAAVTFTLTLLDGAPGTAGEPWPGFEPMPLQVEQSTCSIPLSSIPNVDQFGMNACIMATATGAAVPVGQMGGDLQSAIAKLSLVQDPVAQTVVAQLKLQAAALAAAQTAGYTSDPVYAALPNTTSFIAVGGTGTPFADLPQALLYRPLTAICVQSGAIVDGIQGVYGEHDLPLQGGAGGGPTRIDVTDDPITSVQMTYGTWDGRPGITLVLNVTFTTLGGQTHGPFGTYSPDPSLPAPTTVEWKAPEGQSLLAFSGSAISDPNGTWKYLSALGVDFHATPPTRLGPAGGTGTAFDDLPLALPYRPLSAIRIQSDVIVDGIQAVYGEHELSLHGGVGGSATKIDVADDPITSVQMTYGTWDSRPGITLVLNVTFTTLGGQTHGPFGTYSPDPSLPAPTTVTWKAEEGQSLLAFSGSAISDPNVTWTYLSALGATFYTTLPNTTTFSPVGGTGTPFDDLPQALPDRPLTAIRIHSGAIVDGIQGVYGAQELPPHGGSGGTLTEIDVSADPITFVQVVYGFWGEIRASNPLVLRVTFRTRAGVTYGPFGGYRPEPPLRPAITVGWQAPEGQSLLAFAGSEAKDPAGSPAVYLSALGVTMVDDPVAPGLGGD